MEEKTFSRRMLRAAAIATLLAGTLQALLEINTLLNAFTLATGPPGLSFLGGVIGFGVPLALLVCTGGVLLNAGRLCQPRPRRRSASMLAACLLLQLVIYALYGWLVRTQGSHYNWSGEWFVANYAALPPNEIFGRSAPVRGGIFAPIFMITALGALTLAFNALIFLNPGVRASLHDADDPQAIQRMPED